MLARLIGFVLLSSGALIAASSIDPMALCFKQCDVNRALVELFGGTAVRIGSGCILAVLGAGFLVEAGAHGPMTPGIDKAGARARGEA